MKTVRVGVDVGGTFTDLCLFEAESGNFIVQKIPSTVRDPSQGIIKALVLALKDSNTSPSDVVYFCHGSTVATNALIQHRGAKVGLITTSGFKDLLEIGRQTRPHLYDLQVDKPEVLVSRELRLEVRERIYSDGRILIPLHHEDVENAVAKLKKAGVEAVAVCYLHSYRNHDHEETTKSIARRAIPGAFLSVSHDVVSEFREFERLNTTVINAYLGPVVSRYVDHLVHDLRQQGILCRPYMTRSSGGITSLDIIKPVETLVSGPSSGVKGACYVSGQAGFDDIITLDMGGTSTDVSLVTKGRITVVPQRTVEGYPVKSSMLDVHSVGAGGGTVAWVDPGGLLKVGPQSMGADPGPACYSKGGQEATVTDANIVLGVLNSDHLLGGQMKIDSQLSRDAIHGLAIKLGREDIETAAGIISVVVANMVRAVRVISVQRGYEPQQYVLVSFGGAGPMHSCYITRELSIRHALIPKHPGLLCALGMLATDMRSDYAVSRLTKMGKANLAEVNNLYTRLEQQASDWLDSEGVPCPSRLLRRNVDMRYVGQNYELAVPVSGNLLTGEDMEAIVQEFYRVHEQTYGYAIKGEPTELVTFRVEASGLVPKVPLRDHPEAGPNPSRQALFDYRQVYVGGQWSKTPIYAREHLLPGNVIEGPAVIEQMDTTSLLLPGQRGRIDKFLNIVAEDSAVS